VRAWVAVLLLSAPVYADDGGTFYLEDYYDCPSAPPLEPVDGGYFCPTRRAERLACVLAGCQAERDALRASPPGPDVSTAWKVVVTVVSVVLAGAVGYEIGKRAH